jgi:MoaD family protein
MIITVKYFTVFSELTGKRSEKLQIAEGETVGSLLTRLSARYGKRFEEQFQRLGQRPLLFLLNGNNASRSTKLSHGDELIISYPVGGG